MVPTPDPSRRDVAHRTQDELEAALADVAQAPRDHGTLEMIVVRPTEGARATPASAACTVEGGVEGDDWARRGSRHTPDGSPNPDQQVAVTGARWMRAIADDRARWPLAGDQLVLDLDLSDDALTAGDRLRVGEVEFEVTGHPHNGCAKYRDRFGDAALRVTATPEGRRLHLRGIYLRVVTPGTVHVGDVVQRLPAPVATA